MLLSLRRNSSNRLGIVLRNYRLLVSTMDTNNSRELARTRHTRISSISEEVRVLLPRVRGRKEVGLVRGRENGRGVKESVSVKGREEGGKGIRIVIEKGSANVKENGRERGNEKGRGRGKEEWISIASVKGIENGCCIRLR
jgi:hypothetical protein